MPKKTDLNLLRRRFGRLIVIRKTDLRYRRHVYWECFCDCGNTIIVKAQNLIMGKTQSCGCLQREWSKALGLSNRKPRIRMLSKMCARCGHKKPSSYFHNSIKSVDGLRYYCRKCTLELNNSYKIANHGKIISNVTLRKRKIRMATPPWVNKYVLDQIYIQCNLISKETGLKHHVDHIIPLQGGIVCGLHVPWNLQILPWDWNLSKGNRIQKIQEYHEEEKEAKETV